MRFQALPCTRKSMTKNEDRKIQTLFYVVPVLLTSSRLYESHYMVRDLAPSKATAEPVSQLLVAALQWFTEKE